MNIRNLIPVLFLASGISVTGNSQKGKLPTDEDLAKINCSVVIIGAPANKASSTSFPFSHIKVADERIDKKNSGYFHARQSGDIFRICHANNFSDEINQFLTGYFGNNLGNCNSIFGRS